MNKPKVRIANPGIGIYIKQSVQAYYEHNLLDSFYTTLCLDKDSQLLKLTSKIPILGSLLKRRVFSSVPHTFIHTYPIPEILRTLSARWMNEKITDRIWEWTELGFDRRVSGTLIHSKPDIIHLYEHASLYSLEKAKQQKVFTVYEQPSAHYRFQAEEVFAKLMREEPEFNSMYGRLLHSELSDKRNKRRDRELHLADMIICNSTYTKKTLILAGLSEDKIEVNPLGFPDTLTRIKGTKEKLQFMVSGNLSYQKGVHHVLRVWKEHTDVFKEHTLVLVGDNQLHPNEWEGLPDNVIRQNRMTQDDYFNLLRTSDVLISNTYSDGFGMVMSEAMANGLIVIGTYNSAAPDIIEHEKNGFVIESGNPLQLYEIMHWLLKHKDKLDAIKLSAITKAESWTWKHYRRKLIEIVQDRYRQFKSTEPHG